MRKKDELTKEHTCMQHAHDQEMVFVLLSRDAAAPVAIRAWVAERLRLGKNTEDDAQIKDALHIATVMEIEGRLWADGTASAPADVEPTVAESKAPLGIAEYESKALGGLTMDEAERRYKEMVEIENAWR
jgi:hypothetical protein